MASQETERSRSEFSLPAPAISLPKGGGAIRGIGEKFAANPVTGTGSLSVPIATSPGRSGFGPQLSIAYDSGAGNGPFGFGWKLSLPAIARKTEKGLPQYREAEESDTFILSGAEDLVPEVGPQAETTVDGFAIRRYRPRIEGLFARIERWTRTSDGDVHWRSISRENILSIYGKDGNSRIADPTAPGRIFSWLISESRDDRGNALLYEYKPEDGAGVDLASAHEQNRGGAGDLRRTANRYPKRIRYGNRTPLLEAGGGRPHFLTDDQIARAGWLFEVVFDYGEHDLATPLPAEATPWTCRSDPFSSYRAGFEVRTARLCRRVLIFHHFPDEAGVGNDCLVRSTDFTHATATAQGYTFLTRVTQSGYKRDGAGYQHSALPPLDFTYSQPAVQERVEEAEAGSLENLPVGIDGATYQLADLHGEGIPGILTEQGGGWFYKRNLSPAGAGAASFAPVERVAVRPNLSLAGGHAQLVDLAGDGQPDLVVTEGPVPGLYEHDEAEGWKPFRPFGSLPNRDPGDPNQRFVDLDGDGRADLLITEEGGLVWHQSLGEEGFGPSRRLAQALDEEQGPRLLFGDGTQSVYLADMSGDGLLDLVRVRNSDLAYWPNLGYGRFGAKVSMDRAPHLDHPDQFDQRRVRLADVDGSGTTDLIYLHAEGVRIYFNQSGNSWSEPQALAAFPAVDSLSQVITADLLGNGTACLVCSSPLPGGAGSALRYVNLMGPGKPHLLTRVSNNMGGETRIQYAPSTKFYLADKAAGKPWITRLPFPVHVVERVESLDQISQSRFVTRYAYHHGYFDGEEREFRGFGMVEQWDTEAYDEDPAGVPGGGDQDLAPELSQPPVLTRTWYHTGAFLDRERIVHQYRDEYYQQRQHLPDPVLPEGLDQQELLECLRSLKGQPLRHETYSFDGSAREQHPYSVVENTFEIRLLQRRSGNASAVFYSVGTQSVSLNYERNPDDPRLSHSLKLEVDERGQLRKSCAVVYGRKVADPALPAEVTLAQQQRYITYTENDYTADIDRETPTRAYRVRAPHATRSYEITGAVPADGLFGLEELRTAIAGAAPLGYEATATGPGVEKRLLAESRTRFCDNVLNPLPAGQWDSLGLPYERYQLAFTPGVTSLHYGSHVSDSEFAAAGYRHLDGDANWWIPSGRALYPADPAAHFYLPTGVVDSLGVETVATLDAYDLLVERVQVTQAPWNVTRAVNDYRVLSPAAVTDANQNRTAVAFDALGMVVKSAVMGKEGAGEGDTLADPTVRIAYDLFNWMEHGKPNYVHSFAREQHGPANPRWQESYAYLNGRGEVSLVKAQVPPGKALTTGPDGTVTEVEANPRWVGNGRTVRNNKGSEVKQYEPYFSTTHEFEAERALRETGVTPIFYYDPLGRKVRTLLPDKTLARVEFDPWRQVAFDANDTVKESEWYADRSSPDPATMAEPLGNPEQRAAWLAAKHAGTPGVVHFDSLGRTVYAVTDYGGGTRAAVRSRSDLTGRLSWLYDQTGREVASGFTGMAGNPVVGDSAEKGRRWTFQNAVGALVKTWDEHGRQFRTEYDPLGRPVSLYVQESGQPESLFRYTLYGDRHPQAAERNLLGVAHEIFDQAGLVRVPAVDFKGNPTSVERLLARDYRTAPDWSALAAQPDYAAVQTAAAGLLEGDESFTVGSEYDALNRPTRVTLPDGTVILPAYNEGNLLASLRAQIRGTGPFTAFLQEQEHDARGRRQSARYGNDLITRWLYDPHSFRLVNLLTCRSGADPNSAALQHLHYTFDPVGNITQISDAAQQTHYFRNAVVRPESLFEYDAAYQLIRATGREQAGLTNDQVRTHADLELVPELPHVNDAAAVRRYTEEYEYDLYGNLRALRHRTQDQYGAVSGWTRQYRYAFEADPLDRTNRLAATSMPGDPESGPYSGTYAYDAYGNMTRMPHLNGLDWDFMDRLRQVDLGGGGKAYYVYGAGGERVRRVVERNGNTQLEWISLGDVRLYRRRRRDTGELRFERWTTTISDDAGPIAQVDTKTLDADSEDPANPLNTPLIRYQFGNHLGSATLETDAAGNPLSYEEYHPFGTTAYRSGRAGVDVSLKRYRFSGKERDDETGLYSFGARYYAPWLGRWTSSDPAGYMDGLNGYRYCHNNPVIFHDPDGLGTRVYPLGPEHERDIHTNTPEAKARLEALLTNAVVEENGVLYQINRPVLEWRGDRIGWFFNTRRSDISRVQPNIEFEEGDVITPNSPGATESPPAAPPADGQTPGGSSSVPADGPTSPGGQPNGSGSGSPNGSGSSSGGGGGSGERSFFTSSFFRGLVVGVAITVAVVAVVATGGAALAAIAPAATAAIASSGIGTALAVAGTGLAVANTVQSVRQRDLWNNPISEEQANYNLGLGIGSFAGGALARPVAGAASGFGQGIGRGINSTGQAISRMGGGQLSLATGGVWGGTATATGAVGVTSTGAVNIAGTAMGSNVLMMSGRGRGGDDGDSFERMGRPGRNRPGNNRVQNSQFKAVADKYGLSEDQRRALHEYIQGMDLNYRGLEEKLLELFPELTPVY